MPKTVETGFNTKLASVLRRKHPRWKDRIGAEQTGVFTRDAALQPDLIIEHPGGLPVAVETEWMPAYRVEEEARERLGETLRETGDTIEQALAVRIPQALAKTNQSDLEAEIETAEFEFCVVYGNAEEPGRWPETGWLDGTVNDLARCIELAALSENRVARGIQILEEGIEQAAGKLRNDCIDAPDTLSTIAGKLHQKDGIQTSRMAMAIVANALTFHCSIAGAHQIDTLDELRDRNGRLSKRRVVEVWRHILTNINYWPIFEIAREIVLPIRNGTARTVLERLAEVATDLVSLGATSQHDLCGRMFQRLITDRKFLATFYTLPGSAALVAELATARLEVDWSDTEAVCALRIGDFACGTGALLNAAYEALLSRYRRTGGDDRDIHPRMMEHVLVGCDIMPAATHLTASVLSSKHPSVTFKDTSIVTLPYGEQPQGSGRPIAIGALDLIEDEKTLPLFGTGQERVRGIADNDNGHVPMPHGGFDVVIMNPPFVRPTNHESTDVPVPSFAGFATSDDEMKHMSDRLKKIRKPGMVGHGNAGLASNFIDLAHAKVRNPGGVIALVIPASFRRGKSWAAARRLLDEHYKDVIIASITAIGPTERAFSADTSIADILVVGTRRNTTEESEENTLFVNLPHRPHSILEAVTTARAIQRTPPDEGVRPIAIGSTETAGCSIRSVLAEIGAAGVREADVARTARGLTRGELWLPREREALTLPLTRLGNLGTRGLIHRDINGMASADRPRGPFDIVRTKSGEIPTWPVLWAHDAKRETRIVVKPDKAGNPRPECGEEAADVWERTASRLHFSLEFRVNSQPLAACLTPEPCIGGRAWPNFLCTKECWEKPMALWANTTLGLISFWWTGNRQQEGRANLTISTLPGLTMLDPRNLSETQLKRADEVFEAFADRQLLPANEAWRDETRQALDRVVLTDLLELPEGVLKPLALLRRQWCAEPSVHGGKGTGPTK